MELRIKKIRRNSITKRKVNLSPFNHAENQNVVKDIERTIEALKKIDTFLSLADDFLSQSHSYFIEDEMEERQNKLNVSLMRLKKEYLGDEISLDERKIIMDKLTHCEDETTFNIASKPILDDNYKSESGSRYWFCKRGKYYYIIRNSSHWGNMNSNRGNSYCWKKQKGFDDNSTEDYTGYVRFELLTNNKE